MPNPAWHPAVEVFVADLLERTHRDFGRAYQAYALSFLATLALVFVLVIRPQEIWPSLEAFHLLDAFTALAALGVVIDFALGRQRNAYSPQLPFLAGFVGASYASSLVMLGREGLTLATTRSAIAAVVMLVVMYGARTLPRLRVLSSAIVLICLFVSGVAIHQGLQEPECIELLEDEGVEAGGVPDGRTCETKAICYKSDAKPGAEYGCERVGLFGTSSIERRVRWRGQLGDPNELSVFIGAVLPLLLAMAATVGSWWATGLALALVGLELYAVILTQSRGGQLVIGTVFAAYFVARYRYKGLLGGLLAVPVLLLGGREGAAADASSNERTELLYEGVNFVLQHPIFGLGINGFAEEMRLTAHNSYLLAAAELGMPGFFFWSGLIWTSIKVPITIVSRPPELVSRELRALSTALIVSFLGMSVGIFFLSFTFKQLLFVWLGMCGALYGIVKNEDPSFQLKVGIKDVIGIVTFDVVILVAIYVYTRATT